MNPDNITIIQDIFGGFDIAVQVERAPEVMEKVNTVSDLIAGVPLSRRQNDELVAALTDLVNAMEHSAYLQGVVFGLRWLILASGEREGDA